MRALTCFLILLLYSNPSFLNSALAVESNFVSDHNMIVVDDSVGFNSGREHKDSEVYGFTGLTTSPFNHELNHVPILKFTTQDPSKSLSLSFRNEEDLVLIKNFMISHDNSFDIQVSKSENNFIAPISSSLVKFYNSHTQKMLTTEELLADIRGEDDWQSFDSKECLKITNLNVKLEKKSNSIVSFGKSLKSWFAHPPDLSVEENLKKVTAETVTSLNKSMDEFHDSVKNILATGDSHYLGSTYLNYLNKNANRLQANPIFMKHVHKYVADGIMYGRANKSSECTALKDHRTESEDSKENWKAIVHFAECFKNKSDAEILFGTWGKEFVDRGEFNSYVDMVTTPYTKFTYMHEAVPSLQDAKNLRSNIISGITTGISTLNILKGTVSRLETKVGQNSNESSSPEFLIATMSTMRGVTKDLQSSISRLQELKKSQGKGSQVNSLHELESLVAKLVKKLGQTKKYLCSNSLFRSEVLEFDSSLCD